MTLARMVQVVYEDRALDTPPDWEVMCDRCASTRIGIADEMEVDDHGESRCSYCGRPTPWSEWSEEERTDLIRRLGAAVADVFRCRRGGDDYSSFGRDAAELLDQMSEVDDWRRVADAAMARLETER